MPFRLLNQKRAFEVEPRPLVTLSFTWHQYHTVRDRALNGEYDGFLGGTEPISTRERYPTREDDEDLELLKKFKLVSSDSKLDRAGYLVGRSEKTEMLGEITRALRGQAYETAPCKQSEKWKGRLRKEPWPSYVYGEAVDYVLDQLEVLKEQDSYIGEPYFEPGAKVVGVWGTGSGVAGRWTNASDIDVWVQMQGLTHMGEKYVDQDLHEYFLRHGDCISTPDGKCREIDVIVLPYAPGKDYCTYKLELPEEG